MIEDLSGNSISFDVQTVLTVHKRPVEVQAFRADVILLVGTPERIKRAYTGDYVLRNAAGELHVCDKDEFEQTYVEI